MQIAHHAWTNCKLFGKEEPLKAKALGKSSVAITFVGIAANRAHTYAYVRKGIDQFTFLFIQFTARSWYWFPRFPSWRRHYFLTMKRHTASLSPIFVSLSRQRKRERESEREERREILDIIPVFPFLLFRNIAPWWELYLFHRSCV